MSLLCSKQYSLTVVAPIATSITMTSTLGTLPRATISLDGATVAMINAWEAAEALPTVITGVMIWNTGTGMSASWIEKEGIGVPHASMQLSVQVTLPNNPLVILWGPNQTFNAGWNQINSGQAGYYDLKATINTALATGTVTFFNGVNPISTVPVIAGVATLTAVLIPQGVNSLHAVYNGDSTYAPSTSPNVNQTVGFPNNNVLGTYNVGGWAPFSLPGVPGYPPTNPATVS